MSLWDIRARWYDRARRLFPVRYLVTSELQNLEALLRLVPGTPRRSLDVGTGTGTVLERLPANARAIATDRSLRMLHQVKRKGYANLVQAHATSLPFKPHVFELITAVGVLEYQQEPLAFLQELHRVNTSGGRLVVTFSPLGTLNLLRHLLLQRVHMMSVRRFSQLVDEAGYRIDAMRKSLMQEQILATKR